MLKRYTSLLLFFPLLSLAQWKGFKVPASYPTSDSVHLVHTNDITGDGMPDLTLFYKANHTRFSIRKGNGNGDFDRPLHQFKPDNFHLSDIADLNRDGYPDMVIASYRNNGFRIFWGTGNGQMREGAFYPTGVHGRNIKCSDINNDGRIDIIATTSGSGRTIHLHVFLGKGNGQFEERQSFPSVLDTCKEVYITDKNGDGLPDVAVSSSFPWIVVFIQQTDGRFVPEYYPTYTVAKVAWEDINKDGRDDLVLLYPSFENSPDSDSLVIRFNPGGLTFSPGFHVDNFRNRLIRPSRMRAGDINKDGYEDLLFDHTDEDGEWSDSLFYMLGQGQGRFEDPRSMVMPSSVLYFELADMNSDGWLDIVASTANASVSIAFADASHPGGEKQLLMVYPNPARNFFYVETGLSSSYNLSLYNSAGQLVKEGKARINKTKWETAGLPHGIYFLKASNAAGQQQVQTLKVGW